MQIIPNWTLVALQAIPFFLTVMALYQIIFKPMLAYLDQRDLAMEKGRREAAQLQSEIEARMADYEHKLASARAQIGELRARKRSEAQAEYAARMTVARADTDAMVAKALETVQAERATAAADLRRRSDALAGEIAGRVLGRALAAG